MGKKEFKIKYRKRKSGGKLKHQKPIYSAIVTALNEAIAGAILKTEKGRRIIIESVDEIVGDVEENNDSV